MLEILSHSSHFLPFLTPKRRRKIGKTQPSFFNFPPHFQISPPIEADFRKYLSSLMCKRSKESDMDNLMRKLPIGIQTFEDIRRKNLIVKIGMEFSAESRNLNRWLIEVIGK